MGLANAFGESEIRGLVHHRRVHQFAVDESNRMELVVAISDPLRALLDTLVARALGVVGSGG